MHLFANNLIEILLLLFIIIIIRFWQCQVNYRISVAYRDNYHFINMISHKQQTSTNINYINVII